MRLMNIATAVALFGLALLEIGLLRDSAMATAFICGGVLAALATSHLPHAGVLRLLALLSTAIMFCYFWQFFILTPALPTDWYAQTDALHTVGLLLAGFGMIPVVSAYSCRMKAGGAAERAEPKAAERTPLFTTLRSQISRLG